MRETTKSLKIYLYVIGILGLIQIPGILFILTSYLGLGSDQIADLLLSIPAVIFSIIGAALSITAIYIASNFDRFLQEKQNFIIRFLTAMMALAVISFAYNFLFFTVSVQNIIYLLIWIIIPFYLIHNVKRLSAQQPETVLEQKPEQVAVQATQAVNTHSTRNYLLLLVFVVALLSALWWYDQKTKTDYSSNALPQNNKQAENIEDSDDWQTYRNEEYGFEVEYPNDWETQLMGISIIFKSPDYAISDLLLGESSPPESGAKINVFQWQNTSNYNLEQLLSDYSVRSNKTPFVIDSRQAVSIDTIGELGVYKTVALTIKDSFVYQIEYVYPEGQKEKYFAVFDQILSTFKFFEPNGAQALYEIDCGIYGDDCRLYKLSNQKQYEYFYQLAESGVYSFLLLGYNSNVILIEGGSGDACTSGKSLYHYSFAQDALVKLASADYSSCPGYERDEEDIVDYENLRAAELSKMEYVE